MKNNLLLFLTGLFLIFLSLNVFSTLPILPNGEAPVCVQWDGNVVSNNVFTVLDQTDLNRIKTDGFNCINVDARANFIWTQWTGVPENDFDYTALDDLDSYLESIGMYVMYQPVYDTTGYIPSFIDSNANFTKANYQNNYPNSSPTFTSLSKQISMYDPDLNELTYYWLHNFAQHFSSTPSVFGYITPPNEGLSYGLGIENTTDSNNYWWGIYLPSVYANIGALNTAWGTGYSAFTDVPPAYSNSVPTIHMYHYWKMKSDLAAKIYTQNAKNLKEFNTEKFVTTIKILPDYMYPTGSGRVGYTRSIDLNNYISMTANYIDAVSIDPYPSSTSYKTQSLTLDMRYAYAKALGDSIRKPVFIGEFFPTVTSGTVASDTNYFAQMLGQTLSYVGSDINSGIRGINVFSWSWQYADLSIKGTETETYIKQVAGLVKQGLKNTDNNIYSRFAVCDNTNITTAFNLDYWHYEPFFGFLDLYRKNDNNTLKMYLNTQCSTATEPLVYVNQSAEWSTTVLDINSWINSGHILLSGYRSLDSNETSRADYGNNNRPSYVNTIYGLSPQVQFQNNSTFDVNVGALNTIFSDISIGGKIFSCTGGSICDYEQTAPYTGTAIQEALYSGGTTPLVAKKIIGSGKSIHIGFNLYESYTGNNSQDVNLNIAFRDIFSFGGKNLNSSAYVNYYSWTNNYLTNINSFGATSGTYGLPTSSSIYNQDGNNISITSGTTINVGITSGQNITSIKSGDYFSPTTTININAGATERTITVTCTPTQIAACKNTYVTVDGEYQSMNPFTIIGLASHTITYYSTDTLENTEPLHTYNLPAFTPAQVTAPTCSLVFNGMEQLVGGLLIAVVLIIISIGFVVFFAATQSGSSVETILSNNDSLGKLSAIIFSVVVLAILIGIVIFMFVGLCI